MPDTPLCGLPHYTWPETVCTEPAGHYRPDIDPHAGPLIIDGRHRGGCAWDEPTTPEPPTPDDDYAQATGHEITCTAGFNDECSCGTAPTGLRDRLAVWARHNALTDLEHPDAIDQLAALVEDEIRRVQDAAATINGMRAKAERRAEQAEARIQALTEATILWRDRPGGDIGLAIALSSILDTDKPEPPAATAVIRALRECDRIEAAVHANPQHPDFDGAYLACIGHIRTALNPPSEEATP